jgi:phage terminase large subunit-like protein
VSADLSPAQIIAREIVAVHGLERAHVELDTFLDSQSVVDLAAHEYDWRETWARPKQLPPLSEWKSWGFLSGRGFGKTIAVSKFVNAEVEAGRATSICLLAQDEDNAIKLQVTGPSGLIATAPPWFKPVWDVTDLELTWPNGAKAYVRTPERPGKIRGFDYDLSWLTEIQSWPVVTRDEAFMNVQIATRIGRARIVWDATAKRRHPLLKKLLKNSAAEPTVHVVVRGSTHENADNLATGYIDLLEAAIGGTQQGEEELHGNMNVDADGATVQEAWIERNRRAAPGVQYLRRVIAADPAVTSRAGSDNTGIIDAALGADGKALILGDHTDKHTPEAWATKVLDLYVDGRCDLVIVETNKGGDLLVRNLRAAASERGLVVVVIGKDERASGHQMGVVHVREIYSRGEKADRARPLSTAYEKNRVCHVGRFPELEDVLTTWEPTPGARSPDRLDATVSAVTELLGLSSNAPDPAAGFKGIGRAQASLDSPAQNRSNVARLLGGSSGGGGRI